MDMINVSKLEKGNILKIKTDYPNYGLKEGDTIRVVNTGRSPWDRADYAVCITDKGYKIEIMHNYRDFELIC